MKGYGLGSDAQEKKEEWVCIVQYCTESKLGKTDCRAQIKEYIEIRSFPEQAQEQTPLRVIARGEHRLYNLG